jgi:hypothetical protein
MKKILYVLLGLLFVTAATAVSIGNYYTQDQVDSINVSNFDLQEGFVRDNVTNKIVTNCEDKICTVQAYMVSMDKNWSINETDNSTYWDGDTFVIVERYHDIRFRKQPWADLRDETNATYARQELASWLKVKRSRKVAEERRYLEGLQTQYSVDISDVLSQLE